jgi:hypothetical protein
MSNSHGHECYMNHGGLAMRNTKALMDTVAQNSVLLLENVKLAVRYSRLVSSYQST